MKIDTARLFTRKRCYDSTTAGLLAFRWQRLPALTVYVSDSGKGEAAGDLMIKDHQTRITVAGTALVLHEIPF